MHPQTINLPRESSQAELPFSAATVIGNLVFASGQVGWVPETHEAPAGIKAQTAQALENLNSVLRAASSSLTNVLKVNIYMTNIGDFASMNEVYRSYFPDHLPARTTVGVAALAGPDLLIEIDAVAVNGG